jgi:hypothetical protein
MVTAVEMAQRAGICRKRYRRALRAARFNWHKHNEPWTVLVGSDEHMQMQTVLASLTKD